MTTKRRVKVLEDKIAPNDERCSLVVGFVRREPVKCPRGIAISNDLHECEACSIPEKNRDVLRIRWIDKTGKPS